MFEEQNKNDQNLVPPREEKPTPAVRPMQEDAVLNQEAMEREIFEEEKLSTLQKVTLIIVALIILASLVGGGFWLYQSVFSEKTTNSNTNKNNTNVVNNANSNKNSNTNLNSNTNSSTNSSTDSDGDGLSNTQEVVYGTNPNNPDTDGDGYLDDRHVEIYNSSESILKKSVSTLKEMNTTI